MRNGGGWAAAAPPGRFWGEGITPQIWSKKGLVKENEYILKKNTKKCSTNASRQFLNWGLVSAPPPEKWPIAPLHTT